MIFGRGSAHRQRFFKNGGLTGGLPKLRRRKALQLLGFRRRRISSSPPNCRYANTSQNDDECSHISLDETARRKYASTRLFAVYRNLFGVTVNIDDFDSDQNLQKKKASYEDIRRWVLDKYGEHVTNLDISRTKKLCGLAQYEYKGRKPAPDYYVPKPREKKQEMVLEALKHFGFV